MAPTILTVVSAVVADERADDVAAAFDALLRLPVPDGLVRTELLRGSDGQWEIHSLWRDRAVLDAMRAGPEPPAAPTLFRSLGAEPVLRVFEVAASRSSDS